MFKKYKTMKFNKFMELRESAILLSQKGEGAKLSDYKPYIAEAESISAEIREFEKTLEVVESVDYNSLLESFNAEDLLENEGLFEGEDLNEADSEGAGAAGTKNQHKPKFGESTNPLAKLFRWDNTNKAMKRIDQVYQKAQAALAQIVQNEVKVEVKREEIGKISGPETKVKLKELDAMIEKNKLQKEKIEEDRRQAVDKIVKPTGMFRLGGVFGFNADVIDKHIAIKNTEEKLVVNEIKLKAAQKILTDKEMQDLKDSVKQLKARETKYQAEMDNITQAVKVSVEKDDYTGADAEVKAELDEVNQKLEEVEKDIDDYRNKMADETDDQKKEDFGKNLESLLKNKKNYEREKDEIKKRAKKLVLGSTKKES